MTAIGFSTERNSVKRLGMVSGKVTEPLEHAYGVLNQAIADSIFPGAQVAVVQEGKLIASRGFGRQTYDAASPEIDRGTIYDLASVTKVAATTLIAMKLWERKKLLLDVPVKNYLPKFKGGEKDSLTLRHLFTPILSFRVWD